MAIIDELLTEFQANGISPVELERVLELGFGSLKVASLIDEPETIALLKLVKSMPWLMKVAEARFEKNETDRIMLHAAVDAIMNDKVNKNKK